MRNLDTNLKKKVIDLLTTVIECKITHPDRELIEDVCDSYTEEVIQYLHENRIGFHIKGHNNPWTISISEAKKTIKKLS